MKLIVKGIRGGNCVVDVEASTSIIDLKTKISQHIEIPPSQQTLVLFGKPLQDEKTVGDYPKLQDGSKLFVAVKKPETLNTILGRFLSQYYNEQQCNLIVEEFMKDFKFKVENLSLDDLERIAKAELENKT